MFRMTLVSAAFATQAYLNSANELSIMQHTGHLSLAKARKYIRDASLFRDNPAAKLRQGRHCRSCGLSPHPLYATCASAVAMISALSPA